MARESRRARRFLDRTWELACARVAARVRPHLTGGKAGWTARGAALRARKAGKMVAHAEVELRSRAKLRIYLADLVHDYLPGNYVVPLNVGLLSAYLQANFGQDVQVRLFKSPTELLNALKNDPAPHVVAFSNYSWNQELNRSFTAKFRRALPDTVVCAGGPHIRTDEAGITAYLKQHRALDYYCMFEGEVPLGHLVEYFLSKGKAVRAASCDRRFPGVAYLNGDELVYWPPAFKKGTIENIPSPYLSGMLDDFIGSTRWVPLLETNRGCPFHCTFCVWGVSAMDNVRVFPVERVVEEIRFVAKHSPSPRWIFADANFGILSRDVEIAREIRRAADEYGHLRVVYLWWAKNSSRHTVEIAQILGSLADPLAAVQTMDDTVLTNIKRKNIKLTTMTDLLTQFRQDHLKVSTDVLLGLPGESLESHLETLRKVFDLGFDHINVGNIRLLPGSEMESNETRRKYNLLTRYRLISGGYGLYDGEPIFEFEESVRGSKDIREAEMHSLRVVHFFVWALWNLGIARPLLRWAQIAERRNPLDLILALTTRRHAVLDEFLLSFDEEAKAEWFDREEDLKKFYTGHFDELIKNNFLKLNFKYLARIILDKNVARLLLTAISSEIGGGVSSEFVRFCTDRIYFLDDGAPAEKECTYSPELVRILRQVYPAHSFRSDTCRFEIDRQIKQAIDYELQRFGFDRDPLRAAALALENYHSYFLYDFEFGASGKKEVVGELTGSFDYHAQLGRPEEA